MVLGFDFNKHDCMMHTFLSFSDNAKTSSEMNWFYNQKKVIRVEKGPVNIPLVNSPLLKLLLYHMFFF